MHKIRRLKITTLGFGFLLFLLLSASLSAAEAAESQARAALDQFIQAWNTGDLEIVRQSVNYPHVTHAGSRLIVATKGQFFQDFDALKRQGWVRSTFDSITTRQISVNKVNFLVHFSRYNESGEVYTEGYVFYVVTKQDGHWGMQYRAPAAGVDQYDEAQIAQATRQATAAVDEFFVAFNAADATALLQVNHVPQVMMNNGFFIFAEDPASPLLTPDFTAMRQREDWHHSSLAALEAVSVSPNVVFFELSFERFDSAGEKYRTVPALWVLTKKAGKWGVEFRSLMPASFER